MNRAGGSEARTMTRRGRAIAFLTLLWLVGIIVIVASPPLLARLDSSEAARTLMLLTGIAVVVGVAHMRVLAWRHFNQFYSGAPAARDRWRRSLRWVGILAAWAYWLVPRSD